MSIFNPPFIQVCFGIGIGVFFAFFAFSIIYSKDFLWFYPLWSKEIDRRIKLEKELKTLKNIAQNDIQDPFRK